MYEEKVEENQNESLMKRLTRHKYFHEFTITIILIIIFITFSIMTPNFLTSGNLLNILNQVSMITILALGVGVVIISGGIDLSISAILILTGVPIIFIIEALNKHILTLPAIIITGLLFGGFIGLLNGVNVVYLKIPAFIATLAMMLIGQGVIRTITSGVSIGNFQKMPDAFIAIGTGSIGQIPITVIILAVVLVFFIYLTEKTPFGRSIYFIGGSEEIARTSGINIKKVKLLVYVISGICAGIASIIFTSRHASAQPYAESPYFWDAITAAILGGVALSGGSGSMVGIFIGALIIGVLNNGQDILGVNVYLRLLITGLLILIAVIVSSVGRRQDL